jgi:hypothetical protein
MQIKKLISPSETIFLSDFLLLLFNIGYFRNQPKKKPTSTTIGESEEGYRIEKNFFFLVYLRPERRFWGG